MKPMKTILAAAAIVIAPTTAFAQDTFGGAQQPQPSQQPTYPQQPQQPQQPGGYPQQPGAYPQQPQQSGANLDQLMQMERQDFGVQATSQLHNGQMHGPTPASIPGGQLVTTKGLAALVQGNQAPYFLFDVLGGPETLPNAMAAAWVAQPGSFNDQTQQQFSQMLQQGTQGRKDVALVFYCLSTQCWMSYNAALRAINAGYTNVLWYRGGIEAWKSAGLPTQAAQQPQVSGGQTGQQQPSGYPQQQTYPQQQQTYPQQQQPNQQQQPQQPQQQQGDWPQQ